MSKKKAVEELPSINTLREAIVNGKKIVDLNSLLSTIRVENKNNPNTMNFLVSWSELFSAQVQTANSQQLAEALFHLGRLGYYNDNLLHQIVDLATTKSTDFGYREISQCLYGLGKLKFYDQEFINRIIMRFSDDLGQIQPTYIANLIYGVSKLEYYDQTFLDKFANIAITHMAKLNSQDVAEILLGVAKIGYHNQDLLNGITTWVGDSNFDQRSLINSSYALTLLLRNNNPDNPEHIKNLIVKMLELIDCNQVRSIEGKRQLLSVYYALDEGRRERLSNLSEKLETSWNREIEQNTKNTTTVSNTQAKLADYTRSLVKNIKEEFYIRELGASVDIYLPLINTVIQVDGPQHFHVSNRLESNATTNFNSERIRELGFNLLRVRTDDLNDKASIKSFINERLAEVRNERKTRAFLASNKGKEMDDATFEANFVGLSMASPEIEKNSLISSESEVTTTSVAKIEGQKSSSHKKKTAKQKKAKQTAEQDDFYEILEEYKKEMASEAPESKKVGSVNESYNLKMIECVKKRNITEVQRMLFNNASPNARQRGESHLTVLMIACVNQDLEMVKLLLDAGANPDIANEEGTTALFAAAYIDTELGTKIVKLLLNSGAHANTARIEGETPLLQAIIRNQESAILILQAGANPNAINKDNLSVLHLAAQNGHLEIVERIIAEGQVDLNIVDNDKAQAPIHSAVHNKRYNIVEVLADAGVNLNIKNKEGCGVIGEAIKNNDSQMVKLLLAKGADPNISLKVAGANIEVSPLIYCASNNLSLEYFRDLIDAGADVNALSTGQDARLRGLSSIGFAIRRNNVDAVKLLLASGVDINISYQEQARDNLRIVQEISSFTSDPIAYITRYDQPTENKIRALDNLLKYSTHESLYVRITETKENLLAVQAAEKTGERRPSFTERLAEERSNTKQCYIL